MARDPGHASNPQSRQAVVFRRRPGATYVGFMLVQEPWTDGVSVMLRLDEVLLRKRSAFQEILVGRHSGYGLCLFLDGLVQSVEFDEALYHEAFVHPALVIHGAPRRVLVGGAGEGATLREIYKHDGIESVVAVDLDADVIAACREFLPHWSAGGFDDPRTDLRIEDVRATLGAVESASLDVVLLDVTDPVADGPSVDLFTTAFFDEVSRVLHPDGVIALQSGPIDPPEFSSIRAVRSTLAAVFDWVHVCKIDVPSFHAMWSVTLAGNRPRELCPADLAQRIAAIRPDSLRTYSPASHRAMLELPRMIAAKIATPGRIVTGQGDERLLTPYAGR